MFDLREFLMKTIRGMAANEPAYKVNRYALGWFERDVLTAEDLAEIDLLTTEPETESEGQEATEETAEETSDSGTEETAV